MGMDPVQNGELWEVTVQLDGPIDQAAFDTYKTTLTAFLAQLRSIPNAGGKLKARESKSALRPRSQ